MKIVLLTARISLVSSLSISELGGKRIVKSQAKMTLHAASTGLLVAFLAVTSTLTSVEAKPNLLELARELNLTTFVKHMTESGMKGLITHEGKKIIRFFVSNN